VCCVCVACVLRVYVCVGGGFEMRVGGRGRRRMGFGAGPVGGPAARCRVRFARQLVLVLWNDVVFDGVAGPVIVW